jgi:hypothetical protein
LFRRLVNSRNRANQQVAFELRSVIKDRNGAINVLCDLGYASPGVKVLRGEGVAEEVVKQGP